jgi:hypothetical protein
MHRRSRIGQIAIDAAFFALGVWAGAETSLLASVQAFKLLNITGLGFDLLGVLLLTYVITTSERVRRFVADWGGVVGVALTGFFFLGYYIGIAAGSAWLGGKDHGLFAYFGPVLIGGMASLFFLEDTVMIPKLKLLQSDERRIKFLGGYFLLAGLCIQIFAAFLDLWS